MTESITASMAETREESETLAITGVENGVGT